MELSSRVKKVEPSATLAIAAKAKQMRSEGIDVVSLSAGEPDFDTPQFIKDAAIKALGEGLTKYTPAVGTLELRQAICEKFKRDQSLSFTPENIIVSDGAKHSIFNILFALLNKGDEVLIPAPYWLSYPEMVNLLEAIPQIIETTEATSFKVTPELLKNKLTERSRVLFLNSPSNPTGAVYSEAELKALIEVLRDFPNVTVISDEIYEKLIYDGERHVSIAQLDSEIAKRTVIVNGHSKAYAMTGWRLGYAAFENSELAKAVAGFQSHSTSNPTSFAQAGGVVALLNGEEEVRKMLAVFQKRRDWFYENLSKVPGLKPFKAQGAFYMFVNISETKMDSMTFCKSLLEDASVAAVPGKPFGTDQHVRMSFASSDKNLSEAVSRIAAWLEKKQAVRS